MAEMKTGDADVKQADPSHVKGVKSGNSTGNYERQAGHLADGKRTAESSTGVNPKARNPIDPRMPNLPPG
jgi:hypothetical protein